MSSGSSIHPITKLPSTITALPHLAFFTAATYARSLRNRLILLLLLWNLAKSLSISFNDASCTPGGRSPRSSRVRGIVTPHGAVCKKARLVPEPGFQRDPVFSGVINTSHPSPPLRQRRLSSPPSES